MVQHSFTSIGFIEETGENVRCEGVCPEMRRRSLSKRVGAIVAIMVVATLFMVMGWLLFPALGTLYLLLLALVLGVGLLKIAIETLSELKYQGRKLTK